MEHDKKSIGWLVTTNVYGARNGLHRVIETMLVGIGEPSFRRQVAIAMNTRRFEESLSRIQRMAEFELENA